VYLWKLLTFIAHLFVFIPVLISWHPTSFNEAYIVLSAERTTSLGEIPPVTVLNASVLLAILPTMLELPIIAS
jgi:hypothetical protein